MSVDAAFFAREQEKAARVEEAKAAHRAKQVAAAVRRRNARAPIASAADYDAVLAYAGARQLRQHLELEHLAGVPDRRRQRAAADAQARARERERDRAGARVRETLAPSSSL